VIISTSLREFSTAVRSLFGKWREHQKDNYDGLIEVGCVTNELIPKVIKETNTAIRMDHQMYALGMAQALVHHYMIHEPDRRLRNKSIDIGNCSEGKRGDKGGIIYVAYKLESENISEVSVLLFGYLNKSLANVLFSAFNHRFCPYSYNLMLTATYTCRPYILKIST
jgi:hypothetical protein